MNRRKAAMELASDAEDKVEVLRNLALDALADHEEADERLQQLRAENDKLRRALRAVTECASPAAAVLSRSPEVSVSLRNCLRNLEQLILGPVADVLAGQVKP